MTKYYFIVNGVIYLIKETNSMFEVNELAKLIRENYMEKGDYLEIRQVNPDGSQMTF